MCGRGRGQDTGEKKKRRPQEDGFEGWGGYMAAKRAKLLEQFHSGDLEKESDIFAGVKIMINGLTHPPALELKEIMAKHGGEWHMYQTSATTHLIASNLPNTKIKHLGAVPIVKPAWITESVALGKLLDYKRYLLYTNQSSKQPALNFPVIPKNKNTGKDNADQANKETSVDLNNIFVNSENIVSNSVTNQLVSVDKAGSGDAKYVATCNTNDTNLELKPLDKSNVECSIHTSGNKNEDSDADMFEDDLFDGYQKSAEELQELKLEDNTAKTCDLNNSSTVVNKSTILNQASLRVTKTASDPRFLEEFYNNSRLHLISTLGAEFKQLVGQLRDKSDGKFPGRETLKKEKGKGSVVPPPQSVVMHIDMDCFFVSVGLRKHPELRGKPVAITHAKSGTLATSDPAKEAEKQANRLKEFEMYTERLPEGAPSRVVDIKEKIDGLASMSEIASCSYEARKCGIKNGMFMGQAIKLCPELKTLPYDFEGYREVSNALYKTVASYTLDIEAVSCDEMYVDIKPILVETGLTVEEWASHIRNEIMEVTGCPCSTGFGGNRLQARLATRKAKPAGFYYLQPDDVEAYMSSIALEDLPGVGRATLGKLRTLGLNTCGDVQDASLKILQSELGTKLGEKIKDQSFGRDSNPLNFHHERKSVSAEINYGIRFKTKEECYSFLQSLAAEVFNRLSDINMKSRCLTLKLLVRAEGAPVETAKFLGHGVCDAISKSTTSNQSLSDSLAIYREAKTIYDKLNVSFADLRGMGIQLSKLEKNVPVNKALSNFLKQGAIRKIDDKPESHFNESNKEAFFSKKDDVNVKVKESIDTEKNIKKGRVTPGPQAKLTDFISQGKANKIPNELIVEDKASSKTKPEKKKISSPVKSKVDTISATNKSRGKSQPSSISTTTVVTKGKGRGRTKGAKTNATKSAKTSVKNVGHNTTTMMQTFLGIKQKDSHISGQVKDTNLAQPVEEIDMEVFKQLPPEIRAEVMREYNFTPNLNNKNEKNKVDQSNLRDEKLDQKIDDPITAKQSVKKQPKIRKGTSKSSPFTDLSWDEIKYIIKIWIKSETEPNEADVEMLGKHFRQLAVDRKIEVLKSIFNFLHRIISTLSCPWHQAYFTFVNMMQTGMVERYGVVLLVSSEFSCCQIH